MAGIYKAYDIRGIYPDELDEDEAYKIGRSTGDLLETGTIVVGHDMREVAVPISESLVDGLLDSGQDVIDIGLCSTPMNYNAIGHFGADGGVMVTASHNPGDYIGFKISRDEARPVAYETGIETIETAVQHERFSESDRRGSISEENFLEDYVNKMLSYVDDLESMSVAIDTGNGMGGLTVPEVFDRLPVEVKEMYFELDGTFPNHIPNPLESDNMEDLQQEVRSGDYDLGMAFDGDGDRVAFVDENGDIIPSDMITALLSKPILESNPGEAIVYDLRSSRVVPEEIESHGGEPVRHRVGHAYMKACMREQDAPFGGELSGHYYFRDNYYTDCGLIAALHLLNHLSSEGKQLSELIDPLQRYFKTEEINFEVPDKQGAMKHLGEHYSDGEVDWLDGITVQYDEWWFNVRPSNTEPLLRLNLEAETAKLRDEKRRDVTGVIEQYVSS